MLERSDDPSVEELTQIMEVMWMHETYYTPEQLRSSKHGARRLGSDQTGGIERG